MSLETIRYIITLTIIIMDDILDSGNEEEYTNEEPKPKKSFEGFKF